MKRKLVLFLACISCLSLPVMPGASAAPSAPMPAPEGERFLFIVDMSSGMERLKEENETTIYELLRSGLFGQMQTGDTYGMWTFDKETHAGKFPMQVWDARRASQLATIAAAYLSNHNYENSDDVKRMADLLTTVVRAASNLNVFIISDASSAMRGTPFDKAINTEYRKQRRERSSAKRPFVTTLIARNGSITNYSVVVAGKPILLPERAVPAVAATKAAPPTNRPAGVLLAVTPVTPGTASVASVTTLQNQSTPVPAPTGVATITLPSSNTVAKSEIVAPRILQIVTKSNRVPAEVEPSVLEPAKSVVTLVSEAAPTNELAPELSAPAPAPPAPTPHTVLAAILPAPVTVAARELHPEPGTANPAPPAMVQAAALPVPSGPGAGLFLTFGSLLMAAALFLLFIVHRRLRPAPGASLITQSMERR